MKIEKNLLDKISNAVSKITIEEQELEPVWVYGGSSCSYGSGCSGSCSDSCSGTCNDTCSGRCSTGCSGTDKAGW